MRGRLKHTRLARRRHRKSELVSLKPGRILGGWEFGRLGFWEFGSLALRERLRSAPCNSATGNVREMAHDDPFPFRHFPFALAPSVRDVRCQSLVQSRPSSSKCRSTTQYPHLRVVPPTIPLQRGPCAGCHVRQEAVILDIDIDVASGGSRLALPISIRELR